MRSSRVHTEEGEIIHVEAASLGDFAKGKRLFSKFIEAVNKTGGAKYSQLISMGVIEGGAEQGPSCMFLVHNTGHAADGSEDQYFVFETSANSLSHLAASIQKCQDYFDQQNQQTGGKQ
jgi:hypothetical protein